MSGGRYRVHTPHVINEVMDGEAVIINLATGDYFSLRGSGAYIWSAVEQGASTHAMVSAYVEADAGDAAEVEAGIVSLVDQLVAEGLVVLAEGATEAGSALLAAPTARFEPPQLEKFTDMQDLILLDPVHEVDERGWPHTAPKP